MASRGPTLWTESSLIPIPGYGLLNEPDMARFVTRANAESQFELLDVSLKHLAVLQELAWHHRDPFDRMIIAQAKEMGLTVVTRDPSFELYETETTWDKGQARSR
ncbi:MAG: type II toxin-antitoxin system VapC family toxin [Ignavibacteria bacterium]|nr:type II toxin-antitoxin system VapC family toxin [Ignavibacteria bacterium]